MTQEAAKYAMNDGKKVTHDYFTPNEWITEKDGNILDENGNLLDWDEFWSFRTGEAFQDGWSFYDNTQNLKQ